MNIKKPLIVSMSILVLGFVIYGCNASTGEAALQRQNAPSVSDKSHLECINDMCKRVGGPGDNECNQVNQPCGEDSNETMPDLVIDWVKVLVFEVVGNETDGNESDDNDTVTYWANVTVRVLNQGDGPTSDFTRTQIQVSTFSARNIFTAALAAGASTVITDSYNPIDEGVYNVTAFADILDTEDESNEDNNEGGTSFTVP